MDVFFFHRALLLVLIVEPASPPSDPQQYIRQLAKCIVKYFDFLYPSISILAVTSATGSKPPFLSPNPTLRYGIK